MREYYFILYMVLYSKQTLLRFNIDSVNEQLTKKYTVKSH
jgi:hypothetical protein